MRLGDSLIRERLDWVGDGRIVIDPVPDDRCFQPASVDLHLSSIFGLYPVCDDVLDPEKGSDIEVVQREKYILRPGRFILGSTEESILVPEDLCCIVNGKSSLGRLGLAVHITAGFVDPGFQGNITLELKNLGDRAIRLRAGMAVCQIGFELVHGVQRPYGSQGLGSRYQDSVGVVGSRKLVPTLL